MGGKKGKFWIPRIFQQLRHPLNAISYIKNSFTVSIFYINIPVYYPVLYNILSVSITLSMGEGYENHLWRALFSALVVGESEIEHRDASCVFSPPGVPSVGCLGREYGNWLRSGSMEGFEGGERELTAWLSLMQMALDGINASGWVGLMWVGGSSKMAMNIYCFECTKWTRVPLIRGQEHKASFESSISTYITKPHAHTRASCLISCHSSLDCLFGVHTSNSYLFQGLQCFKLRSSQPTEALNLASMKEMQSDVTASITNEDSSTV